MKLEQQVTNLELSKKLKELGVKQESYFYWRKLDNPYPDQSEWYIDTKKGKLALIKEIYSAFTVAELGEMLNSYLHRDIWLKDEIGEAMKQATYMKNEADARAEMVIYLLENKLLVIS